MEQWPILGGVAGLFATAAVLIWRLVRLGVDQEKRLLDPAYNRIDALEKRIEALEADNVVCQRRLANALFVLRTHGIPVEDTV